MELFFLGSGGGRVVVDRQVLATGGFRIHGKEIALHVDPGPGALVKTYQHHLDPAKLNGIFVSHAHIDHCNDASILVEAMAFGSFKKKKGMLLASQSVLKGINGFEKQIDDYFQNMCEGVHVLQPGVPVAYSPRIRIRALRTQHEDPSAVGLEVEAEGMRIAYTGDTEIFDGLSQQLNGADFLVINCLRPGNDRFPYHLSIQEVADILKSLTKKPKAVFLTHAGMKLVQAGREEQRQWLEKETNVRIINAVEGLNVSLNELASRQQKLV